MKFAIDLISIFFSLVPSYLFIKSHKILRRNLILMFAFILSILIAFIGYNLGNISNNSLWIISLNPVIFLLLYKSFDIVILRKFNHHIYFRSHWETDIEARSSKPLEFIFQLILMILPFVLMIIGRLKYCC